jgi:hypothetical protein
MQVDKISKAILIVRSRKVILDFDLAYIYCVETKALNQAVKRNRRKFPSDFIFQLTSKEAITLERSRSQNVTLKEVEPNRSQFVTGSQKHRDPRSLPYAFTEHGAIMAANVLNSERAVEMSVFVVRAFIRMRGLLSENKEIARKLADLEKELKKRLGVHETAIVGILQRIMALIDPPRLPAPKKRPMGFGAKEN